MASSRFSYPCIFMAGCFFAMFIYLLPVWKCLPKPYFLSKEGPEIRNLRDAASKARIATGSNTKHLRIACMIMTSPQTLEERTKYVNMTWGRRCDRTVYVSSKANSSFPVIKLNVSEGRQNLIHKSFGGLRYVYQHYIDDCDWFFRADDDTYLIIENLRYFLQDYDTNTPIYFGHHFKTIVKQGYSSGGSGFVISKEAMRRFGKEGHKTEATWKHGGADDAAFGESMQSLGVKIGSSVDSKGRSRFHCFPPQTHVLASYPKWYYNYDANGAKGGLENMSDYPISFHYVRGKQQLLLDYLFYHARVRNNTAAA